MFNPIRIENTVINLESVKGVVYCPKTVSSHEMISSEIIIYVGDSDEPWRFRGKEADSLWEYIKGISMEFI
jgi:hypothetical protein